MEKRKVMVMTVQMEMNKDLSPEDLYRAKQTMLGFCQSGTHAYRQELHELGLTNVVASSTCSYVTEQTDLKNIGKTKVFVALTGTTAHGDAKVKVGQTVYLTKEIKNKYDDESIAVVDTKEEGIKPRMIAYVANSVKTVPTGTWSAGRLYDKIPFKTLTEAKVVLNIGGTFLAEVTL